MDSPSASSACPVCDAYGLQPFLELEGVPALCNNLWPSREEARAASMGDVRLAFCHDCGMITNLAFDPDVIGYDPNYENSLHFSPSFQTYAVHLARRLVDTYGIKNTTVVEIGAGKGEFLALLCESGNNTGVGYDPSYAGESEGSTSANMKVVPALWGGDIAKADLVCCRQVLEHLTSPKALVATLADTVAPGTVMYFEVPDAGYMLRTGAIFDVIYEHCSYFAAAPLRRLFVHAGFEVVNLGTSFGDQYLFLELRKPFVPSPVRQTDAGEDLPTLVNLFQDRFSDNISVWSERLAGMARMGRKVAVWGSGSKGTMFLNTVPGAEDVSRVIDINPRKHGRFVPGTGQEICAPEALLEDPVDVVILMNPLYRAEIREQLASLGLEPELLLV